MSPPEARGLRGLARVLLAFVCHAAVAVSAADATGKRVYDLRCFPCHGLDGRGDGPTAAMIAPKPRNFRDPEFWRARTIEQVRLAVRRGRPGTLMPPFQGVLSEADIDAVVAYLQSAFASGRR
jgi:mono/diheme cytochrome c family protein